MELVKDRKKDVANHRNVYKVPRIREAIRLAKEGRWYTWLYNKVPDEQSR